MVFFPPPLFAAPLHNPQQIKIKGHILNAKIINSNIQTHFSVITEKLDILLQEGSERGKTILVDYNSNDTSRPVLRQGDNVILGMSTFEGRNNYYVIDKYRSDKIIFVILGFITAVLLVTGRKGLNTLIGLVISLVAIFGFVLPRILAGAEPVTTSVIGSFFILFITTYISHGISKQTTVAFISTCIGLLLTIVFSFFAVAFTGITGYGTNDAMDTHFLTPFLLNVKGLFLAGIIITTLGALNDVTITQATAVFQLAKQKEKLTFFELVQKGIVVGREHAISLINTLVLAYTGGSLSVLIYFFVSQKQQPVWSVVGNEFLAEEIIRTIGGTIGLVLAVPLATYFAAYVATRENLKKTLIHKK